MLAQFLFKNLRLFSLPINLLIIWLIQGDMFKLLVLSNQQSITKR